MIDIHCHILPGIDDGPEVMDDSIAMARMASEDGITMIVATPHINFELTPADRIKSLALELNMRLAGEGIDISILTGADVSAVIDPALLGSYGINDSRYVLVEFPHGRIPSNARKSVFAFIMAGLKPIITHPERNGSVISDPGIISDLIESGALVQITAGSITGEFGRDAVRCSEKLLAKGLVHFIASDAHSPLTRPPLLSEAVKRAGRIVGEEAALSLVRENPQAVISDCNVCSQA